MIKNYFKIAWRNIVKHRFYSAINILGLFSGLTFAFLIGAYVWGELGVNKDIKNSNQQYILMSDWKDPNMGIDFTSVGPLAKRLKEDYPSLVKNYYRWDGITSVISKGTNSFREDIIIGDSTLYAMFEFKLLHGNSKTIQSQPYSIVITADKAIKYFGKTDVVGETINIQSFSGDTHNFKIEAVFETISKNSVTQINNSNSGFFIPSNTRKFFNRGNFEDWRNIYVPSYIELKKGVTIKDLEVPIQTLINKNAPERIKLNLKVNPVLLSDFYLQKDNGLVKRMVYTLSFVGLFILLMAIINFINISISTAGRRMKEIGLRKVMGGLRIQLILQFLIESFILVFSATILALITFTILSPIFSDLVGVTIPLLFSFPKYIILALGGLILLISLMAGTYPAFVLSSLNPIDSLKGKLKTNSENISIRKSLVGFQFSIALIVLISAAIVTAQIDFFFGQNLGYNKEFVLSAQVPRDWSDEGVQKMEIIRNEFETIPQIKNASLSYEIPNGNNGLQRAIFKVGTEATNAISMKSLSIDENFLATYEIGLKSGSSFNDSNSPDSTGVIINEAAAIALGWENPTEAIGEQLKVRGGQIIFTIKGITNNFHFDSMRNQIQPIIMFDVNINRTFRYLNFRVLPNKINATIEAIQEKWALLMPGTPFEYRFMDETLKNLYTSEIQLKKATYNASLLSLIIVLLGVIGLISLNVHHRLKEIGIRKVLGASVPNIIILFLKEFLLIIAISGIIAFPLAYYIMQDWLNSYTYNIQISAQPFVYSLIGLTTVVILLIGLLTWNTANINPAKSLKNE